MKNALAALLRLAAAALELLLMKRRAKAKAAPIEAVRNARNAVAAGDANAVNAAIEEARMKHRSGACRTGALAAMALCALLPVACIRTRVVTVSADRTVVRTTDENGVAGWFVPDATFADLLENYVENAESEE